MPRRLYAHLWLWPLLLFVPVLRIDRYALFGNTDALFYTLQMKLAGQQLLMGDFWPHWLMAADAGLGAPLMYTYPPLPYLLTACLSSPLWLLGVNVGYRMLFGMYVATVASGYTSFYWLRGRFTREAALPGALLYMLLPYRLVYMYLHFNMAQLWALVWLPLWMVSCDRMLERKRFGTWGFALCAALVGYCHPLTLLAFGGLPVAYVLYKAWRSLWLFLRLFLHLLLAGGIVAALLGAYAVTFLQAKDWIVSNGGDGFTGGRFNVFVNLSHTDSVSLTAYLAIGLMTLLLSRRVPGIPAECRFWFAVLCVLWFMTQRISAPVWHLIVPLQYLQFPVARLHSGMLVAVTFLATAFFAFRPPLKEAPWFLKPAMLWVLVGAAAVLTLIRLPEAYADAKGLTPAYVQTMQERSIFPLPYRTRWSDVNGGMIYDERDRVAAMPQARFLLGGGTVKVTHWKPGRIVLTAMVRSGYAVIAVRQRYVPAWQGFDNAAPLPITILPMEHEGIMAVALQHGRHELTLALAEDKRAKRVTQLSCLTLLAAMLYGAYALLRWRYA